jgi:hypothetical protein
VHKARDGARLTDWNTTPNLSEFFLNKRKKEKKIAEQIEGRMTEDRNTRTKHHNSKTTPVSWPEFSPPLGRL